MGHSVTGILPALMAGIAGLTTTVVVNLSGALMQVQTVVAAVPQWQKAAGGKMSFEVASVRPSDRRDLGRLSVEQR